MKVQLDLAGAAGQTQENWRTIILDAAPAPQEALTLKNMDGDKELHVQVLARRHVFDCLTKQPLLCLHVAKIDTRAPSIIRAVGADTQLRARG